MRTTVKKWGNSASIRIPAAIMEAARLKLDQAVEIKEEKGRVVIEAIRSKEYRIEDLVAGIADGNRHDAVDFGRPQGKEIW